MKGAYALTVSKPIGQGYETISGIALTIKGTKKDKKKYLLLIKKTPSSFFTELLMIKKFNIHLNKKFSVISKRNTPFLLLIYLRHF
ncbi:MAG: hypothetical protein ACETWM_15650 [Candidatus Lokiarchaeia archaeon]